MIKPKILLSGAIKFEDIKIKHVSPRKNIPHDIQVECRNLWNEIYEKAKSEKRLIYDGQSYSLENFYSQENSVVLEISRMRYSMKKPLNILARDDDNFPPQACAKTLAIAGPIRTSDGYYAFGHKSGKTMNLVDIDLIGGIIEISDLHSGDDLLKSFLIEIKEETNLAADTISFIELYGIILSGFGNIILFTHTKLNISKNEVQKYFNQKKDPELDKLIFIKKDNLAEFLKSMGDYKAIIAEDYSRHYRNK